MMPQTILPVQYLCEQNDSSLTSFSGLLLYLEMAHASCLHQCIGKSLQTKTQGWKDQQIIIALILLNLSGGDCVDDIEKLESDEGLRKIMLQLETHGMRRKARRAHERRWRKEKSRAFPSAATIHRYLEKFHNASEEALRIAGKAFIPAKNQLLERLLEINGSMIDFAQAKRPSKIATLDQDATLAATHKESAFYCYKKFKAYQPLNTYWDEQGLLLHSEFRDGNVPAGFEQLRLLQESLDALPDGVEQVMLRSDSAGYQEDLLKYCAEGKNARFGVIEFAIAANVTKSFKQAVSEVAETAWKPIYKGEGKSKIKTEQEWAEVCFVPNWVAASGKDAPNYRYIAIRERMSGQMELDLGTEEIEDTKLPFPTMTMNSCQYKVFGIVTNRTIDGNELINWLRERCGKSEKVHSVQKSDLAGGQFPSNHFGANAAWWQIMVLSHNLNELMKQFALPEPLKKKRMKGLRFHVIGIAGRVISHARQTGIKLNAKAYDLVRDIRLRISGLSAPPIIANTG
jgi:hypothetical protein